MRIFIHWLVSALAIIIAAYLVPGTSVTLPGALVAAIVLGILNVFIRPLFLLLTFPINVLTLGLFTLVINAVVVWIVSAIVPGFAIAGFWYAFLFAIVLTLINWVFHTWNHEEVRVA